MKVGLLYRMTESEFGKVSTVFLSHENFTRMGLLNALTQVYWHSQNWATVSKVSSFVDGMLPLLPISTN